MLIFLDFDGVICDSVLEAYVASRRAYFEEILGGSPPGANPDEQETFFRYRPFIRTGEDFVLLQRLIAEGIVLREQADFDREAAAAGEETMQKYRAAIYRVRAVMLEEDRGGWLGLNRVYPHVRPALAKPSGNDRFYILSTKKTQFIMEILAGEGISWSESRVITAEGRSKVSIIAEVLEARGYTQAVFLEDQPDHFPNAASSHGFTLSCYLATWGYVQSEWLEPGRYTTVTPDQFGPFIDQLMRQPG